MGSKNSKNEMSANNADFKSRFESKMCFSKETPEPIFDLSECNLKTIPAGVFINCQVLRKQSLNLSSNKLISIVNDGNKDLRNLQFLHSLDLRDNEIKVLPQQINYLENLRELLLSKNSISCIPTSINKLKYLEHLDISYNKLINLESITLMPSLRILNIYGNCMIRSLPPTLPTCYNLIDLIFDDENIKWPSKDILLMGTIAVLKFIETGEIEDNYSVQHRSFLHTDEFKMDINNKQEISRETYDDDPDKQHQLTTLQSQQKDIKEKFLATILMEEQKTKNLLNQIQDKKDAKRDELIQTILKDCSSTNDIINNFLTNQQTDRNSLLESESQKNVKIFENLQLEDYKLRKQEIIVNISNQLLFEDEKIRQHTTSKPRFPVPSDLSLSYQLNELIKNNTDKRTALISEISENKDMQKQAVSKLIAENDAKSWSLKEQVKIIENELSSLTAFELNRKNVSSQNILNDLSNKRLILTNNLIDLVDKQEKRKHELILALKKIEDQKLSDQEDFWLLQYQLLLDSPTFSSSFINIDPKLGRILLNKNIIHCLPFLKKILKEDLSAVDENILERNGIKLKTDRVNIINAIQEYLSDDKNYENSNVDIAEEAAEVPMLEYNNILTECVICMDAMVQTVFIPCGHMCCCSSCQENITCCPMCRGLIEKYIKVLLP